MHYIQLFTSNSGEYCHHVKIRHLYISNVIANFKFTDNALQILYTIKEGYEVNYFVIGHQKESNYGRESYAVPNSNTIA